MHYPLEDALATFVSAINRLPTPVLQDLSLYEILHKRSSDYKLLKTFGCACYPLILPQNSKLDSRSCQCIFLSCCSNQKGYRCWDYVNDKVYISRHVKFIETIFPYQDWSTRKQERRVVDFQPLSFELSHAIPFQNNNQVQET